MSKLPSRLASVCSAVLAAALLAVPGVANATGIKVYSYAVKFICEEDETEEVESLVNIHNPSLTGSAEYLLKIVAPDRGYRVFRHDYLSSDEATLIECEEFAFSDEFEGFIVVLSRKPLDVVGVYEIEHTSDANGDETEDLDVVVYPAQVQTVPVSTWNNLKPPSTP